MDSKSENSEKDFEEGEIIKVRGNLTEQDGLPLDPGVPSALDTSAETRNPVNKGIFADKLLAPEALECTQEKTCFTLQSEQEETTMEGAVATVGELFEKRSEFTEQVTGMHSVTNDTDVLRGQGAVRENTPQTGEDDDKEEECPVCAEVYETCGGRGRALLNCDHVLCQGCLAGILARSADGSRVSCPLCRQRTPLPDWGIRKMQEDALYLMATNQVWLRPLDTPPLYLYPSQNQASRHAGRWSELERWLESRVEMGLVCGFFRYPTGLVQALRRLQNCCRCCYITVLVLLYLAELSCFLFLFLPILVLVLLFSLTSK